MGELQVIIDTHVHVVSGDRQRYPALADAPAWPATEAESLIAEMDRLLIDRALLVQTFFTYGVDNTYMLDAAARYPDRFQTVCVIDQTAPDAPAILTNLVRSHGVRGLRLMPKGHPAGVLSDPRTYPVWERAHELGIVVTVAAELEHLEHLPGVLGRFPEVKVCLEHMWALEIDAFPYPRLQAMFEMAEFPNVHLKLCPNNSHAARASASTPQEFFGLLVHHFGIKRMMWGSNYPAHIGRFGKLADRLHIMQEDFSFLDEKARSWFFGETALSLWPGLRCKT